MNESVKALMDRLFDGAPDTEEIRALREEITNNCQEHFQDLMSGGLSEEEASEEIAASLRGMEDVVAEMSRNSARAAEEKAPAEEMTAAEPLEDPALADAAGESPEDTCLPGTLTLPVTGLKKLKLLAGSEDLALGVSGDHLIHVSWDPDSNVCLEPLQEGDTLVLNVKRTVKSPDPEESMKQFFSLDSESGSISVNFRDLGRRIKSIIQSGIQTMECVDVKILVPAGALENLEASSRSGDIRADGCGFLTAHVRTVSGDVEYRDTAVLNSLNCGSTSGDLDVDAFTEELILSTLSGDVEVQGGAVSAEIKSTSGDLELSGGLARGSLTTVSGDINVTLRGRLNVESLQLRTTSGDVELDAGSAAPAHYVLSTVSGDIDNSREDSVGGALIQASTVSGDITIC